MPVASNVNRINIAKNTSLHLGTEQKHASLSPGLAGAHAAAVAGHAGVQVLQGEQDLSTKRNAFMMLCQHDRPRAVNYLLTQVDNVAMWGDILQMAVLDLIRKVLSCMTAPPVDSDHSACLHAHVIRLYCQRQYARHPGLACKRAESSGGAA